MIRPPSVQRQYDEFYSRDPAFVQLPEGATPEQREEHQRKWSVARETGVLSELLIENQIPTKFVMKPLRGELYRTMLDHSLSQKIGPARLAQVAFRASVVEIEGLPAGAPKIKRVNDDDYGDMASVEIADYLDSLDVRIVAELGGKALERIKQVSPKS